VLVIRLSRTGRSRQAAYRLVVAENSAPVKGKFLEVLGGYNPSEGKKTSLDKDRIAHWIKQGARPSETAAALLKANGVEGVDQFVRLRHQKRAKKNPSEAEIAAAQAAAAPKVEAAPVVEEAPAAEEAAPEETPAEA
jgi:small subunit ribosomal protein S16